MSFPSLRCTATLSLVAALGCATTRGEFPAPPTDAVLANDGTREEQEALFKRYQVKPTVGPLLYWSGFDAVDVGDARRPSTGGVLDLDVHHGVGAYLASGGVELQKAYLPWRVLGYAAAVGTLAVGVLWLGSAIIFSLVAAAGLPGMDGATSVALVGTVLPATFGVLVLSVALGGVVLLAAQFMVKHAIHVQLDEYNVKLRDRIQANVMKRVQAPTLETPPPVEETPAAPVEPTPDGVTPLP